MHMFKVLSCAFVLTALGGFEAQAADVLTGVTNDCVRESGGRRDDRRCIAWRAKPSGKASVYTRGEADRKLKPLAEAQTQQGSEIKALRAQLAIMTEEMDALKARLSDLEKE